MVRWLQSLDSRPVLPIPLGVYYKHRDRGDGSRNANETNDARPDGSRAVGGHCQANEASARANGRGDPDAGRGPIVRRHRDPDGGGRQGHQYRSLQVDIGQPQRVHRRSDHRRRRRHREASEALFEPGVRRRMKIVIVGGVAGGMSAATRLRRLDERAGIIVLERSSHVSYANCGLPYFLGGVIEEEDALLLETPATLHDRFRLDVRVRHEVLNIDREAKSVSVKDWARGFEYELTYDKLIRSPGAFAVVPPLPGIERAFTLRPVEDVERLIRQVDRKPKSAVIIGGGFIGVEVAENLVRRGIRTAIVEATPQLLAPLDPEMASFVAAEMQAHGGE